MTLKDRDDKNSKLTQAEKFARLDYLVKMIGKYAHRWSDNPSIRLSEWVYEYNNIRDDDRQTFYAYCEARHYCKTHDGYDLLA